MPPSCTRCWPSSAARSWSARAPRAATRDLLANGDLLNGMRLVGGAGSGRLSFGVPALLWPVPLSPPDPSQACARRSRPSPACSSTSSLAAAARCHIGITLARVAASFVLAMAIGIALGIAMGRSLPLDRFGHPWLVFFLNIPALVTIVLRLHLDRADRDRADRRGRRQQDPERHGRRCAKARARSIRNLLEMAACFRIGRWRTPAARRPAAALPLSRGRRPLGPRPDLEDRAGDRAARPLERRRLRDRPLFPAVRRRRHPRLHRRLRRRRSS